MNEPQRHVIRRQTIDLALHGSEAEGIVLQNRLMALCHDKLTPVLDEIFTRHAPADQYWCFDRIEVDAGQFTPETLERDFVAAVQTAVSEQIQSRMQRAAGNHAATDTDTQQRTPRQSLHEAFLYFLRTGILPWWYSLPSGQTLADALEAHWNSRPPPPVLCRQLRPLLGSAPLRARLVRQFKTPFLTTLLEGLAPQMAATLRRVIEPRQSVASTVDAPAMLLPENLWHRLFQHVASARTMTEHALREALHDETADQADAAQAKHPAPPKMRPANQNPADAPHHDDALRDDPEPKPEANRSIAPPIARHQPADGFETDDHAQHGSPSHARDEEGINQPANIEINLDQGLFINAAGVVLLHPFIPALFERLGVARDKQLQLTDRALALLHFLATGEPSAPEHALALPKLLCGLDIDKPAPAPVVLTADEQAEATDLLHAAIAHWDALGDTTPDALRGTFLVRPGKLFRRGGEDTLQLEPQSFDILLGKLPWGISPVCLPWMQRFLWVEWPY